LEKVRKEHLIVEEAMKQSEKISVMESCHEQIMYRCELEEQKSVAGHTLRNA
jgi:hypothetical protein